MKQLFTILSICAASVLGAQVFSESFDSGIPGSMIQTTHQGNISWTGCGGNTGGAPCPIAGSGSATFFNGSYTAYSTSLSTPVLDLSSGVYKVTFKHVTRSWGGDINELHVEISTNGGSTWTTMESYLTETANVTERSITLSPYGPSTTTQVRFRAVNHYGYRLILDDVAISEVTTDDVAFTDLDIASIIPQGDTEIKGTLKNEGFNNLTSFDLNWQVNDGAVNTQNYTGQNIEPGQEFHFNHSQTWASVPGAHSLKVWVSNPNVTDADNSNDEITKPISVASNSVHKVPLYEKFSSSTCPPCYGFNTNAFNPFFANYGHNKATLISYQVNWPGAGDPYYTAEVGARVSYYGINAAPTLLLNTVPGTYGTSATLQQALDQMMMDDPLAFFTIDADHTINGNNIEVEINVMPYLTGNFTVRAMVIEKETTGNVANNGETEFHHVFMKALPNANGTTVSFEYDVPQTLTLSADLSSTNVEEMDDLAVVIFIQDNSTKQILQSGYTAASGIVLGLDEQISKSQVMLVPNPTTGMVRVVSENDVQLQVFDLAGRNVYTSSDVKANATLDLSGLGKGTFIVNITGKDGVKTVKKLMIK
ncbi:MAG: T9SS type A sorting domain-containing protein [Moheibacter sp.]